MDGLEISEINFSEAIGAVGDVRWDSEYYKKEFLEIDKLLKLKQNMPFFNFCNFIKKGVFDLSPEMYQDEGVPFIRTSEIKKPTISFASTVYLSEIVNNDNSKTMLYPKDLVFTKIGAYIGDVAILPNKYEKYNFSQNVAGASLKDKKLGAVLLAFFLSKYGRSQILRSSMLSGQGKLELDDIRNYKIPIFNKNLVDRVLNIYNLVEEMELLADVTYINAEDKLAKMSKIRFIESSSVTSKNKSCSLDLFGRLDAEYYQPKYEEYEKIITQNKGGYTYVKKEFDIVSEKCSRLLKEYPYVEIGDIDVGNGIATSNIILTEELPDNAKIMTKTNDVLVSTVRPNRGAVAILEQDNLLVSGAFTVLREKGNCPKEVLQVLLRSEMYRDWMLRYNVGTSYPVIKNDDILNLPRVGRND